MKGIVDLGPTLKRIETGGSFPHRNDGSVFMNREGLLSSKPQGYYREFVHPTPGERTRDADQHEVVVVFPADAQLRVRGLLKAGASGAASGT